MAALLLLGAPHAGAQVVPETYRQQKQAEAARFADSLQADFARYLEQLWTEYQLFRGEPSPRGVKLAEQPSIDTADRTDTLRTDRQLPYGELSAAQPPETDRQPQPFAEADRPEQLFAVPFYGRQVSLALPEGVARERLAGTRERQVARFWRRLADEHADRCAAALDQQRRNLCLGDWGLFDLVRHLAATVYPDRSDEQALLTVFLLNALHLDARLGRMGDRLVTLLNTGSRLYEVPYIELDSVRYYAFGQLPRRGRLHTYSQQAATADRPLDMHLAYSPRLGGAPAGRPWSRTIEGRTVALRVNQPLIDFYARYPQTELPVYATAALEEAFAAALGRELRPLVGGRPPKQAVDALLLFVQQGFDYQTDRQQFGHEKNFFCKENFHYPANDCEDRAVLFARLVQLLLGYRVALLAYDDHVAAAVCLPGPRVRGHHLDLQGRRYMLCDPTCLGATVGTIGRKYRNKTPKIIML